MKKKAQPKKEQMIVGKILFEFIQFHLKRIQILPKVCVIQIVVDLSRRQK